MTVSGGLTIFISTTVIYFFIIFSLRLLGKKELAQLSTIDLVFILLLSNSVQNAMVGSDNSVPGGMISAGTLFLWNYVLKLILYRFGSFDKALQGEPVLLIYKGLVRYDNLERLKISPAELNEAVREHGVASISEVDLSMFEKDGNISVLSDSFQRRTIKKRRVRKGLNQQGNG